MRRLPNARKMARRITSKVKGMASPYLKHVAGMEEEMRKKAKRIKAKALSMAAGIKGKI